MLFRKLRIESSPGQIGPVERWYLILQTPEDVLKYNEIETELMTNALFSLPASLNRSHLEGSREQAIHTMFQTRARNLKEGEKLYPIIELAKLINGKAETMLKLLSMGKTVLVQQSAGYCDYESFADIWKVTIVDEMEKDTCYFPTDNEPIETDLLFIENGERVPVDFEREVDRLVANNWYNDRSWVSFGDTNDSQKVKQSISDLDKTKKIRYKLTHLKLRDPKFVSGMIEKAKVIAVETQLVDSIQIDRMMKLFALLKGKTLYIKTPYKEDLTNHELWSECNSRHTVNFI